MPKAAPAVDGPTRPTQPLCTGCRAFADGACPLLINLLATDDQAVVSACTHYDPPIPREES